jgi:hypothetical protein
LVGINIEREKSGFDWIGNAAGQVPLNDDKLIRIKITNSGF